jgi:peptidoglycan/LPS O-acetylase OafA/YrhL
MNRIPSLDGLRAISILLVVIGHLAESRSTSKIGLDVAGAFANLGVQIFFVISGYLITKLLLQESRKTGTISLRQFYIRRAYRILPAAMFYMLPVFFIFRHELRWYHAAAAMLYLANFDFTHPWFLGHLWSLSVEEQFYLLWPSVLKKWTSERTRVYILVGVIAFAPFYRILCHALQLHGQADGTFPAVADALATGCLLSIVESQLLSFLLKLKNWRLPFIFLLVLPVLLVPIYWGVREFHLTLALLFLLWPAMHFSIAGLLLCAVQSHTWILNAKPIAWLGKVSYSLYLWQQLFVYGKHPRAWYGPLLALGMASISYYLVERPALRLREKRPSKANQEEKAGLFPLTPRTESSRAFFYFLDSRYVWVMRSCQQSESSSRKTQA